MQSAAELVPFPIDIVTRIEFPDNGMFSIQVIR
jgi:hypothetical protein